MDWSVGPAAALGSAVALVALVGTGRIIGEDLLPPRPVASVVVVVMVNAVLAAPAVAVLRWAALERGAVALGVDHAR